MSGRYRVVFVLAFFGIMNYFLNQPGVGIHLAIFGQIFFAGSYFLGLESGVIEYRNEKRKEVFDEKYGESSLYLDLEFQIYHHIFTRPVIPLLVLVAVMGNILARKLFFPVSDAPYLIAASFLNVIIGCLVGTILGYVVGNIKSR